MPGQFCVCGPLPRYLLGVGTVVAFFGGGVSATAAQEIVLTPYVGAGPERNGISAGAGVRLEIGSTWAGYGRVSIRASGNVCEGSSPPHCNYPEGPALEYGSGVMKTIAPESDWNPRLGLGIGVLSWQNGYDPFFEATVEAQRQLSAAMDLVFGLHTVVAPGVERGRSGLQPIVNRTTVLFPNLVFGLRLRL